MTTNFIYPSSFQLQQIERDKIVRLTQNRPIFEILPMQNIDAAELIWEQQANITGLQSVRGLNGSPTYVDALGLNQYYSQPGIYGEFRRIDETQITMRRKYGSVNQPVDLTDLVTEAQDQLLQRRLDRIESLAWTLLATGTFSATNREGKTLHTDTYTCQTYDATSTGSSTPWSTAASSTPLADFRAVQILARGHSVDFGRKATAFMNQTTFNYMVANTNAADLYGRRVTGLATANSLAQVNELFTMDNLPNICIYDEGYFDDNAAFQLYIPTNKVIIVGKRQTGVPVGNYLFTRNANNPDLAPGPYMRIIDNLERSIPRSLEVHDGKFVAAFSRN